MTEEQMFYMSDDELEAAFREARAQDMSPKTDIEMENSMVEDEPLDLKNLS